MDWVIFILPACLVAIGLVLILIMRYDYRARGKAARDRAEEEHLAARLNARHHTKVTQYTTWQRVTPVALEDAFDRFASKDVAPDKENLPHQVDAALDEFTATTPDANDTRDTSPRGTATKS